MNSRRRLIALAAFAGVLVVVPFWIRSGTIKPTYYQQVVDLALIWSMVTVSLTLLAGTAGQVSLGQGGFMAVGAYTSALLATEAGWPLWATSIAAVVMSAVVGVAVGLPALRLKGPYLVMATLAFAGIAYGVARNWVSVTGGPQGVRGIPTPAPFGRPLDSVFAFHFLLAGGLLVAIVVVMVLNGSHRGLRMKAVRDDIVAAEAIGIRSSYERTVAFGISAAIAGLAGAFLSGFIGFISPDSFTIDQSILALTMALVGGITMIAGAIVGAFALVILTEVLRDFSQYQLIAYGAAILVVVTLVPGGIMGALIRLQRRAMSVWGGRRRRFPLGTDEVAKEAGHVA